MTAHTVFCSACDRNVSLVPRSNDWTWHIVLDKRPQAGVACLDRGLRCTGALCPFCAALPNVWDREEASRAATQAAN